MALYNIGVLALLAHAALVWGTSGMALWPILVGHAVTGFWCWRRSILEGIAAPPNKGMKQTSVEHIGRSQLIPGVDMELIGKGPFTPQTIA